MASLTGREQRRIQPKLRMIRNGDTVVNALRAEQSPSVVVSEAIQKKMHVPELRGDRCAPVTKRELRKPKGKKPGPGKPSDSRVSVFIDSQTAVKIGKRRGACDGQTIAEVTLAELDDLAANPSVSHVELGEAVKVPRPIEGDSTTRAPGASLRKIARAADRHEYGKDVLIGIIDVGGFDFSHPDFLTQDGKGTRFERIWDQGGSGRPAPKLKAEPGRFRYGAELRKKEHLDKAIGFERSGQLKVPAWEIERQSQTAPSSHGTHVASIAAGNSGVCRNARIAGVLIDLPASDLDRRKSFYDSTRIADAVDYLIALKDELHCKAVAINISLGTNGHAHDASSAVSRWIDARLATPGISVCVAAGNAGQEAATPDNPTGYITGRIHTSGRLDATGLARDIEWVVVGNRIADISENELEIWYPSQDRFSVAVRPPGMDWQPRVEPGEYLQNYPLPDGTMLSCYHELYHPANGSNYIGIFLSPGFQVGGVVGVHAGTWTVRLYGDHVRDGRYHGWIERDDPRDDPRDAARDLWRFPSFFTEHSNVDESSVSSLACGRNIVSVANLDPRTNRIAPSSSQGPTRDGRQKPEVAAPGTEIPAARGFFPRRELWVNKSGTSMAAPYMTGVAGLMLAIDPTLTAAQIGGVIRRTARPLTGHTYEWQDDAGFGRVDASECVAEAGRVHDKRDLDP